MESKKSKGYVKKGPKNYQKLIDEHKDEILNVESKKRTDYVHEHLNNDLNLSKTKYKIYQLLYRNKLIDKKYKKIKYHILTMLRLEIDKADCPPFSSKKTLKYCEKIKEFLINDTLLLETISKVTTKIDSLNYDLESLELSKSTEFVKSCLELYR